MVAEDKFELLIEDDEDFKNNNILKHNVLNYKSKN